MLRDLKNSKARDSQGKKYFQKDVSNSRPSISRLTGFVFSFGRRSAGSHYKRSALSPLHFPMTLHYNEFWWRSETPLLCKWSQSGGKDVGGLSRKVLKCHNSPPITDMIEELVAHRLFPKFWVIAHMHCNGDHHGVHRKKKCPQFCQSRHNNKNWEVVVCHGWGQVCSKLWQLSTAGHTHTWKSVIIWAQIRWGFPSLSLR